MDNRFNKSTEQDNEPQAVAKTIAPLLSGIESPAKAGPAKTDKDPEGK